MKKSNILFNRNSTLLMILFSAFALQSFAFSNSMINIDYNSNLMLDKLHHAASTQVNGQITDYSGAPLPGQQLSKKGLLMQQFLTWMETIL